MTAGAAGISINISANAAQASQALNNINVQINNINNTTNQAAASASSFGRLFAGAFAGLSVGALANDILKTNIAMETLRMQLKAVSGSAEEASYAFDFIHKFAADTPFEIDGITKTFLTLQNYGIKPTAETMNALTNEAAKLGGRQETLTGISIALGQAWSKGKLQGQEILQMVNQGVPIWDLLSQTTGKSVAELQKMSDAGEITRDTIAKLIVVMGQQANGSNAMAMDTMAGKISNLSDAWHTFEDALLQDKSEGLIKNILSSFTNELNILSRNMDNTLDNQIAHAQARIQTMQSLGAVGSFVGDYFGYDVNQEKNRIDALNKQKSAKDSAHQAVDAGKDAAAAQKTANEAAAAQQQAYWNVLVENANEADKAKDKLAKHDSSRADQSAKQYAAERENIAKTIEQLKFELDTIQLSDNERKIQTELRNKAANATEAERTKIESLIHQIDAETDAKKRQQGAWDQAIKDANDYYDLRKEISAIVDSSHVTSENLNAGIGKIQDQRQSGAINDEQAKVEFDRLSKAYNTSFANPAKDGLNSLSVYADQSARNMQTAFAQFLFDPFGKGANNMVSNFAKATAQMIANAASANLLESLFGQLGSKSGGGKLGGLFGSLFNSSSSSVDQFGADASGKIVGAGGSGIFDSIGSFFSGFFANGGDTPGGYRIVGEKGPELEATGPARIFNAQQTQAILGGGQNSGPGYTFSPTYNLNGNNGANQQNIVALNEQINSAVSRIIVREQRAGGLLAPS